MFKPKALEIKIFKKYLEGSINHHDANFLYDKVREEITFAKPENFTHNGSRKRICLFKDAQNSPLSKIEFVSTLVVLLSTPGLLRWISLNLLSQKINGLDQSYYLSRSELIFKLISNAKVTVKTLREHLAYEILDNNLGEATRLGLNDFVRGMTVGRVDLSKKSILTSRLKLRRNPRTAYINSPLVTALSRIDSINFLYFLLEYGPEATVLSFMKIHNPDGYDALTSKTRLKTKIVDNSGKTFDEIKTESQPNFQGNSLRNLEIWHQRFLIKDGFLFEFDDTGSHLGSFVAGHWQYLIPSRLSSDIAFLETPSTTMPTIGEAILLSGRADENWYHLLLDTLPRYLFLKNLPKDIPVLIRDDLPQTSLEFLTKLVEHPIIQIPPNSRLHVKTLHFLAARSTVYDSIPIGSEPWVKFSPKIIELMSTWIKHKLEVVDSEGDREILYFKRRSRQRRIINTQKIENTVEKFGYKIINDNDELYRSQIQIFSKLLIGVSAGGAILSNMIFMPPGSTLVCLRSSRQNELELWKQLAMPLGIKYFEVVGVPTYYGKNRLKRDHSNFYISPRKLRKTLGDVMQATT
jgi:hypothetical protein